MKEIEKNLLEFGKSISKPKKDHDYDDNEYRGMETLEFCLISHLMKIITNQ